MRVFVYEYICSTGLAGDPLTEALQPEGLAMLAALVEDLARIPGVEVLTLVAQDGPWLSGCSAYRRSGAENEAHAFRKLAQAADFTLVIAPECDDILATRCAWVEEAGSHLLGPSRAAVHLTADKWSLAHHWQLGDVPTPPCRLYPSEEAVLELRFPVVCKPRFGAGSQATFLLRDSRELSMCAAYARHEGIRGELLLQPYVAGRPASVALLIGPQAAMPLPAAAQHLSADGRFHYLGGSLPLEAPLTARAQHLARRAVEVVPGLRGYVGVDLILGEAADGSLDWALEINPRLTTSYVGLRALAETNLAEVMLRLVRGEEVPTLSWRAGTVHFEANGNVQRRDSGGGCGEDG
jgi:predicted ATP-grasp superfamily ATP-dependent carboligase